MTKKLDQVENNESRKTFNFTKENNVETMDLATLRKTYREEDPIYHKPLMGIHHFELIDRVGELLTRHNIDFNIEEIFAAHNNDKYKPGVTIVPDLINKYGPNAIEAHCLRRVFTTIRIDENEDKETNTGLAIAFHQNGVQMGIGPNVKICHNQCILSPDRYISTYGSEKVKDFDKMLLIVDEWLSNFAEQREQDVSVLTTMKGIQLSYRQVAELIGHLNYTRVGTDCGLIKEGKYPLNGGQINQFTENYLKEYYDLLKDINDPNMSLYDIYNLATNMYKANQTVIPNILPQNIAWTEMLINNFGLR